MIGAVIVPHGVRRFERRARVVQPEAPDSKTWAIL